LADHAFKNSRPKGGTESHPAAQRKWSEFPETCGHIFRNPQSMAYAMEHNGPLWDVVAMAPGRFTQETVEQLDCVIAHYWSNGF
jgi:hypothetical protein